MLRRASGSPWCAAVVVVSLVVLALTMMPTTQPFAAPEYSSTAAAVHVVTYNIWFDSVFKHERAIALLDLCASHNADVICLQEVTTPALAAILAHPWVRENMFVSDAVGRTLGHYGVMILSRFPFSGLWLFTMESRMGRNLLVATMTVNGEKFAFGTAHLESLDSAPYRASQLSTAASVLNLPGYTRLFMGDFNFDATRNFVPHKLPLENDQLAVKFPDYVDVWAVLHPDRIGYTFDTDTNAMLDWMRHEPETMRYDRILAACQPRCTVDVIEMIGTEPITNVGDVNYILPSDHYGLVCRIAFIDPTV